MCWADAAELGNERRRKSRLSLLCKVAGGLDPAVRPEHTPAESLSDKDNYALPETKGFKPSAL